MVLGQLAIHMWKNRVRHSLSQTIHKNQLKIDLNIRAQSLSFLGGKIGPNLCDLGLGHGFLDRTPKVKT